MVILSKPQEYNAFRITEISMFQDLYSFRWQRVKKKGNINKTVKQNSNDVCPPTMFIIHLYLKNLSICSQLVVVCKVNMLNSTIYNDSDTRTEIQFRLCMLLYQLNQSEFSIKYISPSYENLMRSGPFLDLNKNLGNRANILS